MKYVGELKIKTKPPGRSFFGLCSDENNIVYCFGGGEWKRREYYNDLWAIDGI